MSMRRYNENDFRSELEVTYGCTCIDDYEGGISDWETPQGHRFTVPAPEGPDGFYPDFILDRIININSLQRLPQPNLKTAEQKS